MKTLKAINKKTNEIVYVQYLPNRLGNYRMWIDGKFYSDKQFDRLYKIIETLNY